MKKVLRKKFLATRNNQLVHEKLNKEQRILRRLIRLPLLHSAKIIAAYLAHANEVHLDSFIANCLKHKKSVAVPKVICRHLHFYELERLDALRLGHFKIREPFTHKKVPLSQIEVMLVPGVAFDLGGHRLGFGHGFYDRLLARFHKLHRPTIGIAFEFQIIDKLPTDTYDVPVDFIVTETRIIPCRKNRMKS